MTSISSGDPGQPGIIPYFITGVLLSRNLVMTGKSTQDQPETLPNALGPFALRASPKEGVNTLRTAVFRSRETVAIRVDGTQIVGFFCKVPPRIPNTDPKFFR
jgi:hypothetical protein